MNISKDQDQAQTSRPERQTRRLTPSPGAPTTRAELLDALLVERYAVPTPEWHNSPADLLPQPCALRLIVNNGEAA